jgi:cell division protein FtsA
MSNIYAALEIGTTKTVLAIGEVSSSGRVNVTSFSEIPSSGIRKSQILNIDQAVHSIKTVLRDIQKKQNSLGINLSIGSAYLVTSGQHIKAIRFQGTSVVGSGIVTDEDINAVWDASRNISLPSGREMLDIQDQAYSLDTLDGLRSPKGHSGRVLKLNTLQIHADANRIADAKNAALEAKIEIAEPIFSASCAAEAVLRDNEKNQGVIVLDFRGGSTGYAVYIGGYMAHAGVVGVGGDQVTNDISQAFQTTFAGAEKMKRAGSAIVKASYEVAREQIPSSTPLMDSRTYSCKSLDVVINSRLKELLGIIRNDLEEAGIDLQLHSGAVLTGGGAQMNGLCELVKKTYGLQARIGTPIHIDGFPSGTSSTSFASIAGGLLYAHRNDDSSPSIWQSIVKRFMK